MAYLLLILHLFATTCELFFNEALSARKLTQNSNFILFPATSKSKTETET